MRELSGRVAVVTGAATGIGRALAERFAREGMRVVLADVETAPLRGAERELAEIGDVLAVHTDVSRRGDVDALAARAFERFGAVHVLCNNAGVAGGGGGALWETTERDWAWVLGVNLMGVVHSIQAFVPVMQERGEEGHIVNTSSVLGLSSGSGSIYGVSKHAVTRLTEGLHHDLVAAGSRLRVSLLCPGMIATRIVSSERNRPGELRNPVLPAGQREAAARREVMQKRFLELGMPPSEVASAVVDAIRRERFYVLTHPKVKERVEIRMRDILEERTPTPLPPFDLAERGAPAR